MEGVDDDGPFVAQEGKQELRERFFICSKNKPKTRNKMIGKKGRTKEEKG